MYGMVAHLVGAGWAPVLLAGQVAAEPVSGLVVSERSGVADGVHDAEILAAIRVDDDMRLHRRRLRTVPEKELPAIALEADLDVERHSNKVGTGIMPRQSAAGLC